MTIRSEWQELTISDKPGLRKAYDDLKNRRMYQLRLLTGLSVCFVSSTYLTYISHHFTHLPWSPFSKYAWFNAPCLQDHIPHSGPTYSCHQPDGEFSRPKHLRCRTLRQRSAGLLVLCPVLMSSCRPLKLRNGQLGTLEYPQTQR